jgi:hypothetical protein
MKRYFTASSQQKKKAKKSEAVNRTLRPAIDLFKVNPSPVPFKAFWPLRKAFMQGKKVLEHCQNR